MAERGRRRPEGSPSGREPRRVERARDPRARDGKGRSPSPADRAGSGKSGAGRSGTGKSRPKSTRVVQTPPPPKKRVGAIEFETPALWTKFTERFHGGEGASPRRVVIVVALVCFLGLALASPLRTFFEMRSEAAAVAAEHAVLTSELAELEARNAQLDDPDYVRAQARERLGFVTRGETPYIVELPGDQYPPPEEAVAEQDSDHPWYKNLWDSVSQPLPDENPPPREVPNVIPGPSGTP